MSLLVAHHRRDRRRAADIVAGHEERGAFQAVGVGQAEHDLGLCRREGRRRHVGDGHRDRGRVPVAATEPVDPRRLGEHERRTGRTRCHVLRPPERAVGPGGQGRRAAPPDRRSYVLQGREAGRDHHIDEPGQRGARDGRGELQRLAAVDVDVDRRLTRHVLGVDGGAGHRVRAVREQVAAVVTTVPRDRGERCRRQALVGHDGAHDGAAAVSRDHRDVRRARQLVEHLGRVLDPVAVR